MSELMQRLDGQRVVICAGAGGVGKTTVSAAVALGLAAPGQRVAVVTIDPARRLAEALGLEELANQPQLVDAAHFSGSGFEMRGELSAMMLDVKRTFDEVIRALAPNARIRDQILANPIYESLSTSVAGSQEYTAIAKLFELVSAREYDVIVLDTPPSRSAIDFLQAPERLIDFFEGRAVSALMRPTGGVARAGAVVFTALRRITGVGLLDDLTTFFALVGGLQEGFNRRAAEVSALLRDPATGFLIVTSTERTPLDEAIYFAAELESNEMRRRAVVVNRMHPVDPDTSDQAATTLRLRRSLGPSLAERVARTHSELQVLARRDHAAIGRLREALDNPSLVCVADRAMDVNDAATLIDLRQELFCADPSSSRMPAFQAAGR